MTSTRGALLRLDRLAQTIPSIAPFPQHVFSLIFLSIAALPLMPWSTYSGASASRRYPCLHREKVYLEAEGGVGKVSDLFAFMISMCVATSL